MKKRIESAIEAVLQNLGDDWFIIIEEPEQEKFVQFAYDEAAGLYFDLPFQALDKNELEKARRLLAEFSIVPEQAQAFDKPGGREVGVQESFNHAVGRDIALAVTLTYRVFLEVYGYSDSTPLNVTIMR